ncbi:MAG: hypothetical protein Q9174_003268 [Haloplaca sp. 1 TL-2023]
MDPILEGLNNAQLAAVTSPADVLQILAPPGSGKTKTLTSRVAYLLSHQNYKPWNILCLTFTIKSAREMKERLAKLIGNGREARLVLGTFHSVCRRYLVSYGHLIGIDRSFGIADSSDSLSIIKRIVQRLRLTIDPKVAQSRISNNKSKGIRYAEIPRGPPNKKNIDQQEFLQVFEAYENQLERGNLLDYDDLLLRCSDLLRQHPSCVSNVEAVLIDEFQDTNLVQFDLMRLFAAHQKRITTVGDPDQSIYGWRSAEIKNLKRMKTQYPDTLVINLESNYRSSGAILLAAQELIEQDESRPSKSLLPTHCPGTLPVLRRLPSSDIEASWIVSEIKRSIGMTGRLLQYHDFAILLRSAALSRQIESAMGKAGIPYRMVGGQRFFERVEVKILLDYLRVISQPSNNDAVARVLNIPARNVGDNTVKALLEEAENKKLTLWTFIRDAVQGNIKTSTKLKKSAEQGLGTFIQIILTAKQRLKNSTEPMTPQFLLRFIVKKLNFEEHLKKKYGPEHEGRWANVEELISLAAEYQVPLVEQISDAEVAADTDLPTIEGVVQAKGDAREECLSMFLANVALATELQKDEETEDGEVKNQSQVTISTIHAAKGLEWPVVFVPAAYEGSIPHSRAEDTDEERRLLYVAMTRAQALLYISCPVKNSRREESALSHFLDPKTLGHYLVSAGPKIDSGVVSDIARILRRPCPSASEINVAVLKLPNRQDDQWPLDGSVRPEEVKTRWKTEPGEVVPANTEKPFGATVSVGFTTTLQNSEAFSVQSFGGFTSATNQLNQLKQQRKQTDAVESSTTAKDTTSRKRKATDPGQNSLTDLWGTTSKHLTIAKEPRSVSQRSSAPSRRNDVGLIPDRGTVSPKRPLSALPVNQAKNKLVGFTNFSIPRIPLGQPIPPEEQFVFLSSSPPQIDAEQKENSLVVESKSAESNSVTNVDRRSDGYEPSRSDFRSAVTRHTTSMEQFQATSVSRKTLGVRRSMTGWNTKTTHGFSVPKKIDRG